MSLKTKVKSYSFWVSLASAIILILKLVGQKFGFSVDEGLISDLFTSLCAILVLLGIIVVPSSSNLEIKTKTESSENLNTQTIQTIEKLDNISENLVVGSENCKQNQEVKQVEELNIQEQKQDVTGSLINDSQLGVENENIIFTQENAENENVRVDEFVEVVSEQVCDPFNLNKKLEEFIDKVCLNRNELGQSVEKFAEFLQNELDNVKNSNN